MKVTLRQRQQTNRIALYLDYYHEGDRQYESLDLYLHPEPVIGRLTKEQRQENQNSLAIAEAIRSKRHLEIQNKFHGFPKYSKSNISFIRYLENNLVKKRNEDFNSGSWDSAIKQIKKFEKKDITFSEVNKQWLESFKEYLQHTASKKYGQPLSINTQVAYFSKVCAALRQAQIEGIIHDNPALGMKKITPSEFQREFLSYDEIKILSKTTCEFPELKNAFLFSVLSGLRWSDIEKLIWSEIYFSEETGYYIRFRQKKTKGIQTLPIAKSAFDLVGERKKDDEKIFKNLKYSAWTNLKLREWILKAGITKKITFHCARHSYATLQLTLGTDIYTVSKMLGHKNVKTTQVYANVIDQKKIEAANKIIL